MALINDGWVSLNNEYTVMPTGDYEMVVDIGGNTAVKIWTTLEDSVHAEWGKSIELIVQHEVDNVKHQLYFRVLLGGEEGRDIPFMRVHSLDAKKVDGNIEMGQVYDDMQKKMVNICKVTDISVEPTYSR